MGSVALRQVGSSRSRIVLYPGATREGTWTTTPDASWSRSELSLLKVKSESVSDSVVSDSLQHCGL